MVTGKSGTPFRRLALALLAAILLSAAGQPAPVILATAWPFQVTTISFREITSNIRSFVPNGGTTPAM